MLFRSATFHPTFLYEAFWNLMLMSVLIVLTSRTAWARERVLALYVLGYGIGRLGVESLRIDHASVVLGMRINIWISLLAIAVATAAFSSVAAARQATGCACRQPTSLRRGVVDFMS